MPRLFVATYLGSEGVQLVQDLAHANERLSEQWNVRVRWVTADKLHLTWLFLGDVAEASVDDVADALGEAVGMLAARGDGFSAANCASAQGPSEHSFPALSYDHLELWPSARKARLGVIVPSAVPAEIVELSKSISRNLSKFLTPEQQEASKRQFKPHLTVMRLPRPARKNNAHPGKVCVSLDDIIVPSQVFPISQSIDRVELIESDMGKKVQGYVTRAKFIRVT